MTIWQSIWRSVHGSANRETEKRAQKELRPASSANNNLPAYEVRYSSLDVVENAHADVFTRILGGTHSAADDLSESFDAYLQEE